MKKYIVLAIVAIAAACGVTYYIKHEDNANPYKKFR